MSTYVVKCTKETKLSFLVGVRIVVVGGVYGVGRWHKLTRSQWPVQFPGQFDAPTPTGANRLGAGGLWPKLLCGRILVYSRRHASIITCASSQKP